MRELHPVEQSEELSTPSHLSPQEPLSHNQEPTLTEEGEDQEQRRILSRSPHSLPHSPLQFCQSTSANKAPP